MSNLNDRTSDLYGMLGVTSTATDEEIRKAYLLRARVLHPDRFDRSRQPDEWAKANEMLRELNEAYNILRDVRKRADYDAPAASASSRESGDESGANADEPSYSEGTQRTQKASVALCYDIRKLPKNVVARMIDRQRGELSDQIQVTLENWRKAAIAALAPVLWLLFASAQANDYLWTGSEKAWYIALNFVAVAYFVWGARSITRWRHSLKPKLYITPLYVIATDWPRLSAWWIWDIASIDALQKFYFATSNQYLLASVQLPGSTFRFRLRSNAELQNLRQKVQIWSDRAAVALRNREMSYFIAHDDLFECRKQGVPILSRDRRSSKSAGAWGTVVLILACVISAALIRYNEYCDDKKAWTVADSLKKAAAYRRYLSTHSAGRWRDAAHSRLDEIYRHSTEVYVRSRTQGFDLQASQAITDLLAYARATQDFTVGISFQRQADIPPDLEIRLREKFGVTNILPLESAFTDQSLMSREQKIVEAVSSAFRQVIPEDVLKFASGTRQNGPNFVVSYQVRTGKSLYYRQSDAHIDTRVRPFYPGVFIDWNFEIWLPSTDERYRFSLASQPAQSFSYRHSGFDDENTSVYDSMSQSAFEDFEAELVKRFGLSGTVGGQ